MAHQEFGRELMERCMKALEEKALIEQYPKMEGNYFGALLGPKVPGGSKPKPAKAEKADRPEKSEKPEKVSKSEKSEKKEAEETKGV